MSINYTRGPLVVAETYADEGDPPETCIRGMDGRAGVAVALDFGANNPSMREDNARRIVACWNAFERVLTEDIESLHGHGGVVAVLSKANSEYDELEKARADLVAMTAEFHAARNQWDRACSLLNDILTLDDESTAELAALGLPLQPVEMTERIRSFLNGGVA